MFNCYLELDFQTYNNMSLEKFKLIKNCEENGLNFTIWKIKNNTYWK